MKRASEMEAVGNRALKLRRRQTETNELVSVKFELCPCGP